MISRLILLGVTVVMLLVAAAIPAFDNATVTEEQLVFGVEQTASTHFNTVNGVIGDESFLVTFGHLPDVDDSEDLRLRTHLAYVEKLLRAQPVGHLPEELRQARSRNLDRLHDYWTAGVFPRNTVVREHRNPVFIDEVGRICAVGYLFEQDMGREAANRVNEKYQTATIYEIDDSALADWLKTSGLTGEEAAMIQPAYGPYVFALYNFDTDGPTVCGSNENPVPSTDVHPEVTISDMNRGPLAVCNDGLDDVFGSSGFGPIYGSDRSVWFEVGYTGGVEDLWYLDMIFDVWRTADGPSEGRVVVSTDNGITFEEIYSFPITTTVTTEFAFGSFDMEPTDNLIVAFEARGGSPSGTLYLDDVMPFVAYTPVELTSFNATVGGDEVALQWVTASETNNAGFEVQMRGGGEPDFKSLGFVEGHGTTSEVQNYQYTVNNLLPGSYSFRLKQIDFDGAFEYSDEIEATVSVSGSHLLTAAYPNPFNPQSRFELSVAETQHVSVNVFDALGRQVLNLFDGVLEGGQTHPFLLDAGRLATGMLLIQATGETFSASQTVTLIR
ncbi:MAG: hypothetical protein R3284_03065 [Rubricoccaceae bacterium]|nr:hypothetical protein [Rubricoccaceae bacterium]